MLLKCLSNARKNSINRLSYFCKPFNSLVLRAGNNNTEHSAEEPGNSAQPKDTVFPYGFKWITKDKFFSLRCVFRSMATTIPL